MTTYHVSVIQVHPDGALDNDGNPTVDMNKNCSKYVFGPKQCLTVGEANILLKEKREEYLSTQVGKLKYSVTREHY